MNNKIIFLTAILVLCVLAVTTSVFAKQSTASLSNQEDVVCTQEAKLCPDGSYVSRQGSKCEFAPCPSLTNVSQPVPVTVSTGSTITVNPVDVSPIKVEDTPVSSAIAGGAVPMIITQINISEESQEIKIIFDEEAKETQISVAGATVSTTQVVQVEQEKLYMETSVGSQEIKISPAEASGKVPEAVSVQEVKLEEVSQEPVYNISGIEEAKVLFIIPVSFSVETQVSAQTGEIMSVKKPWWSFLAW